MPRVAGYLSTAFDQRVVRAGAVGRLQDADAMRWADWGASFKESRP
jgi:hypothetical protein